MALVFYLHYEAPEDEKNFAMIMEMLRAGEVREDDDSYQSPLDELFERLEMRSPCLLYTSTPQSNHTKKTKSGSTARNYSGHVMLLSLIHILPLAALRPAAAAGAYRPPGK